MDLSYIFFNALVYGVIASALSSFFAYAKFLNLALGSYLMGATFVVYLFAQSKFVAAGLLLAGLCISYVVLYVLLLRHFSHEKQRDLVALIISLMLGTVLANILQFFFGSGGIYLSAWQFSPLVLMSLFFVIAFGIYYVFEKTYYSIVFKGLFEKSTVIQSLGISLHLYRHVLYMFWFSLFFAVGFLLLHTSGVKAVDGLFYLLKGLAIMIMVGISRKQYIFVGTLIYVLIEYLLFIKWGIPIAYKESMIMIVILWVLLFKPEGLFSLKTRGI